MYKFKTMNHNTSHDTHVKHIETIYNGNMPMTKLDSHEDNRIINGTRIIRKTHMDELPQLFNVLKGEMSLIGPRPCLVYELELFKIRHFERFETLPGMTGMWQVNGKNCLTFDQMVSWDIYYTRKINFLLDLWILKETIPVIFGKITVRSLP